MMVPIQPETPHVVGWVFDIHPSVGKWETLVGERGFFSGGWRGLGHGGWGRGMSLKDCHVISKEGGEGGVFCEARCGLSGVEGERERDHWFYFGYGRNGRSLPFLFCEVRAR